MRSPVWWRQLLKRIFGPREKNQSAMWCPHCGAELFRYGHFHMAEEDDSIERWVCDKCDCMSRWLFGAPVAILLGYDIRDHKESIKRVIGSEG